MTSQSKSDAKQLFLNKSPAVFVTDDNECLGSTLCDSHPLGVCVNTQGNYTCMCDSDSYYWDEEDNTCQGKSNQHI